ncbi:hypothetical protein IJG04_00510, partial [Candidatus Saccharibacteria bacterium]|nr:hypothetical protein [Candidatus Saccharibacteria bacterium]
ATVSSTTTKTYTYTFDGWYTASSGGTKVITNTGALVASVSGYTNSSSQWIATSGVTLYAHWTAGTNQTLPTITQTDSTNGNGNCYWSSTNSTTGGQTYTSGATISGTSVSSGATLYGVCKFPVKITFAGTGVSSVKVCKTTGNCSGTNLLGAVSSSGGSVSNLLYGTTYYLYPTFSSNNELNNWKKTSAKGALAGTTTQNTTSTTANPSLTIGTTSTTGSVGITITGKSSCTSTTFSGYMQDITTTTVTSACDGSSGTMTDKRDSKTYTVKKINGQLWMTQNLRYLGDTGSASKTMTIGNNNSNVANNSITLYSLNKSNAGDFNVYSSHCESNDYNGYDYACVYDSGSTSIGVWYNYYAASGGTISTNSNNTAAASDICPKNWHLPTGPNTTANKDFNKLVGNTTSGYQNPTTGLTAFSAVAGGIYVNGALSTGYGEWWSATANGTTNRYRLLYNSSDGQFHGSGAMPRYVGISVRCVRSS